MTLEEKLEIIENNKEDIRSNYKSSSTKDKKAVLPHIIENMLLSFLKDIMNNQRDINESISSIQTLTDRCNFIS